MTNKQQSERENKVGFWSIVSSTLMAALGVQKREKLEKDFAQASPLPFIVAGVVFTVLFILSLFFIVSLVLK